MGNIIMMLSWIDVLGYAASGMTLATFAQRNMLPMRIMALGSNVCFIGYGAMGPFLPVLTLHLILLPINLTRLRTLVTQSVSAISPSPRTKANDVNAGCSGGLL
jgi:hypothetical protein